jgi:hypothetical protein
MEHPDVTAQTAPSAPEPTVWPLLDEDALTDLLASIAERLGVEAVRWLLARHGGRSVSVPQAYRLERLPLWLEDVATRWPEGDALARLIVELRGGEVERLPSAARLHREAAGRLAAGLYDGTNASDLAERLRVDVRFVRQAALGTTG